jgi:hypothetical protein
MSPHPDMNLRAGEWIEVRSKQEILATLDESGCLENLPFMPEMLQYCGQKLRVVSRADKTCDNIGPWSIRRMQHSVHLEGVRCDGGNHGGCQAGCLIFWKEAWLKRADAGTAAEGSRNATAPQTSGGVIVEDILSATERVDSQGEISYACQATQVLQFTSRMAWWDPRQYVRDLRSGNLESGLSGDSLSDRTLEFMLSLIKVIRAFIISCFKEFRHLDYPSTRGALEKTPLETLGLRPGELVQVRCKEEILATLDPQARNRGLLFDREMLPYCGEFHRVHRRVDRIIDEKTGKMMYMKQPCIILDGVVCRSEYNRFCPRAIYSYWREEWLRRVSINAPQTEHAEAESIRRS